MSQDEFQIFCFKYLQSSWRRVFMNQIGLVNEAATKPERNEHTSVDDCIYLKTNNLN